MLTFPEQQTLKLRFPCLLEKKLLLRREVGRVAITFVCFRKVPTQLLLVSSLFFLCSFPLLSERLDLSVCSDSGPNFTNIREE